MFETIDLSPRAGSEIRADRQGLINGDYSKQIEKLLVQRSALVFRELFLTDEEQLELAKTIGNVVPLGEEGVSKISLDPKVSESADSTRGAFFWRIDGANDAVPAKATMHWATQDQYVYRHKWKVGDFLLWDNTGTMHRADSYPLDSKRLMHRTTLHGEESVS